MSAHTTDMYEDEIELCRVHRRRFCHLCYTKEKHSVSALLTQLELSNRHLIGERQGLYDYAVGICGEITDKNDRKTIEKIDKLIAANESLLKAARGGE